MATKIKDNAGFLKSMAGAILLFAFTLFGMAEMTGFQFGSSRISEASNQAAQQASASASTSVSQVVSVIGGAVNQAAETAPPPPVNTSTGTVAPVAPSAAQDYLVEISAFAVNSQIPQASLSSLSNFSPPANVGEFDISRDGDGFTVSGDAVIGVGYILEGSSNLRDWFAIARNIPITQNLEFSVQKDSRLEFAYLRVRAERVLTAASMNIAALVVADLTPAPNQGGGSTVGTPIDTQPVVTGILGGSGGN